MAQIKGRGWNKFRGYISERIVAHFLKKYLPNNVKLVRSAFVSGCEKEFDLIIVDKNAKSLGFRSYYPGTYARGSIKLLIEIKASGLYYPNKTFKSKLKQHFQNVQNKTGKPFLYLSIWESVPKAAMTRKTLGSSAFILKEGKRLVPNEWQNFVNTVLITIQQCQGRC